MSQNQNGYRLNPWHHREAELLLEFIRERSTTIHLRKERLAEIHGRTGLNQWAVLRAAGVLERAGIISMHLAGGMAVLNIPERGN